MDYLELYEKRRAGRSRVRLAPPDTRHESFDILLPNTPSGRRAAATRMANSGVAHTVEAVYEFPRADQPGFGQIAIMNNDERQAKYGKPIALFDHQPGKTPLMIVGGEKDHWQALKEQADETRHYRKDQVARERPSPTPRQWIESYANWEDTVKWKRSGRNHYATTRGVL